MLSLPMVRFARLIGTHPDATAVLALSLLSVLVLGRGLVPGKVLSPADTLLLAPPWSSLAPGFDPANPLLTDVTDLFHPWLMFAAAEIRAGHIPLWNPHVFAGAPFFANPQAALLFPLTWLALMLPVAPALALIAITKLAAAGAGTYVFLRARALHPLAAFMGAVSFMLCAPLVVWLQWSYASTLIVVPLLFAAVDHLRAVSGGRPIALVAVVVALAAFAGYPQGLVLSLLAASAWALSLAWGAGPSFLVRYAAGVGLGLALAAVQLLPFIEYAQYSAVLSHRSDWLPPLHASLRTAVNLLMPHYYGGPTGRDYWGEWNFNEVSASVGLAPWMLLPVALLTRRRGTAFFAMMAVVAGALFYGAAASLETGFFIITFRLSPFLAFPLCILCALGMDAVLSNPGRLALRVRAAVQIAFIAMVAIAFVSLVEDYATMRAGLKVSGAVQYAYFLALSSAVATLTLSGIWRGGVAWAFGLLAVQVASLAPLALTYNPVIDARLFYPTPAAVSALQREAAQARGRVLMAANMAMLYGLDGVAGYDGMTPRFVDDIVKPARGTLNLLGSGYLSEVPVFTSPVRDLLGIRHILVPPNVALDGPELVLRYRGTDGRIYRNEAALPRAFVVPRARCADDRQALDLIRARAIDYRQEVLLNGCGTSPIDDRGGSTATVAITHDTPERIVIGASTDHAGYLVVTDTWFPGWSARVNGRPATIERANHAFRSVKLEPGQHEIELRYEPASVRIGLVVSLLALGVTATLGWRRGWRRRQSGERP